MNATALMTAIVAALTVVAADQVSKTLMVRHSRAGAPLSTAAVRLELGYSADSRLRVPRTARLLVGFVAIASALSVLALVKALPTVFVLALGLAAGGAVSNIVDLVGRGAVVDFISIGRWPTFNLADAALSMGLALTVLGLL